MAVAGSLASRVRLQHAGALPGEQLGSAAAVDHGQHRPFPGPAAGRQSADAGAQGRDHDAAQLAGHQSRFDRGTGVVGVHVHRVAVGRRGGDGHRFAQLLQPIPQHVRRRGIAAIQQVHHLELRPRPLGDGLGRAGSRRELVDRTGRRLAGDRRAQRVQQHQQPAPAGIHRTGVGQHVKLLGGLLQRDHRRVAAGDDRGGQPLGGALLDGAGGGAQHRDDGPRDLLAAHRGDHQLDAAPQGGPQQHGVYLQQFPAGIGGRGGGDVGDAAQNLRQDHAGVAPGAVERAGRQGRRHPRDAPGTAVGADPRVGLRQRGTHGEQHVRAGIGVSDREHIEAVDLVDVGDQVADGGVRPIPQGRGVQLTIHS